MNIRCLCGNPNAYWNGNELQTYACAECHGYNTGLSTAISLVKESVCHTEDKEVLICAMESSMKGLSALKKEY